MSSSPPATFVASLEAFHDEARERTALEDFGDPSYQVGLRGLAESLDEDLNLSAMGRAIFRGQIVETLATRLKTEARLKAAAARCDFEIRRPIVILGLVRTGSTALHYLMGQDPDTQKLEYWLAEQPQPRPPRETWADHSDFQASVAELKFFYEQTPSLMAVHEMNADWPEECRHLLAQTFTDDRFESAATLPRYNEWYHGTSHLETYQRHRDLVRLIGCNDPERRWLLKYPVHLRQLDALFAVYPDACVVQTHRDPRSVVASYASFISKIRAVHQNKVDVADVAREQMESWAHAAAAGLAFRREHGSERFYDLYFDDFMSDPLGSVKKIYTAFDQELSDDGERALIAWREAHPQGKHGEHRYDPEATGIAEQEILDRFADYLEFFSMV